MTAGIYGISSNIKVYSNGRLVSLISVVSITGPNLNTTMKENWYVGQSVPKGTQSPGVWEGSLQLLVADRAVDDFIQQLFTATKTGVGFPLCSIVTEEKYPDGTVARWNYTDCQFSFSQDQPAGNEQKTKTLNFRCMDRLPL